MADKVHKVSAEVFRAAKKRKMLLTIHTPNYTECGSEAYVVTRLWKLTTCKNCLKKRKGKAK